MPRLCLLLSLVAMLWAPLSRAQPDIDRARELGREGIALYQQEKYEEALARLSQADALHHAPTLVLYMARSERKLGKLLAARARYESLVSETLPADAPEQFRTAKDTAYKELQDLSHEIPKLLIVVDDDDSVEIDGKPITGADLEAPVPLDPGAHEVAVTRDERTVHRKVTLDRGSGVTRLALSFEDAEDGSGEDTAAGPSNGLFIAAMVGFGLGAAGLVMGGITGGIAASKAEDIKSRCNEDHCLATDAELGDEAETLALVSTVGFLIGAAGAAAGIVLIIVDAGTGDEAATVALGPIAVRVEVRF